MDREIKEKASLGTLIEELVFRETERYSNNMTMGPVILLGWNWLELAYPLLRFFLSHLSFFILFIFFSVLMLYLPFNNGIWSFQLSLSLSLSLHLQPVSHSQTHTLDWLDKCFFLGGPSSFNLFSYNHWLVFCIGVEGPCGWLLQMASSLFRLWRLPIWVSPHQML